MKRSQVRMSRVYDPPGPEDGARILLDRLWPRGVRKKELKFDLWARDLAPSTSLRQWYHRDPERFAEFRRRYLAELGKNDEALAEVKAAMRGRRSVTLLTAAKDLERSHVAVLRDFLTGRS